MPSRLLAGAGAAGLVLVTVATWSTEAEAASTAPAGAVTATAWAQVPALVSSGAAAIVLDPAIGSPASAVSVTVPAGTSLWIGGADPANPVAVGASGSFRALSFTAGGPGASVEIANLYLTGRNAVGADGSWTTSTGGGGLGISSFAGGSVVLRGLVVEGVCNAISAGGFGSLTVDESTFRGNPCANGGALQISPSDGPIRIEDSTFIGNGNKATAYYAGAINVSGGRADLVIDRSVFLRNTSGGRGGAIFLRGTTGSFTVRDSYFEGNSNNFPEAGGTTASRSDGGAIGVEMQNAGPTLDFLVDGSSFVGNSAYDEGGAILVEGLGVVPTTLRNSTFVANLAAGKAGTTDGSDGGGAVEITDGNVLVDSSTFAANTAAQGGLLTQRGGAITNDSSSTPAAVKMQFRNSLLLGNTATSGKYQNVYSSAGVIDLGGNLGIDNGTALPAGVTAQAAFGTASPTATANGSSVHAGDPRWALDAADGGYRTVPSVPIVPRDAAHADGPAGIADNAGTAAGGAAADQRHLARRLTPDVGAVELVWLRYDANGGTWASTGTADPGQWIPAGDTIGAVYQVGDPGDQASGFASTLGAPVREGYVFGGWSTTPSGGDDAFTSPVALDDQTLYAIWTTAAPQLTIRKQADAASVAVGGSVLYTLVVTNHGPGAVTGVSVSEGEFSGTGDLPALTCPPTTTLAAGESLTCTVTYPVPVADLLAGRPLSNTASASGLAGGEPVDAVAVGADGAYVDAAGQALADGAEPQPIAAASVDVAGLTIRKTAALAAGAAGSVGDRIDYTFAVANTGSVPLHGLVVEDLLPGLSAVTCASTDLAVSEATTCSASYVVTAQDVSTGRVTNTAAATALGPDEETVRAIAVDQGGRAIPDPDAPADATKASLTSTATVDLAPEIVPVPEDTSQGDLALTGAVAGPLGLAALALVAGGTALVVLRRGQSQRTGARGGR